MDFTYADIRKECQGQVDFKYQFFLLLVEKIQELEDRIKTLERRQS